MRTLGNGRGFGPWQYPTHPAVRSPSGTFATSSPTAKTAASPKVSPASRPTGKKHQTGADRDHGDQPRNPADLALQRALFAAYPLAQRRDAPQLG